MQSSLGLVGDLDDVALIEDVEEAFSIRFSDADLERSHTVGDLFERIKHTLPNDDPSRRACATSMCFFRMRSALQPQLGIALRPKTPAQELNGLSVRALYKLIQRECGLRPPAAVISVWGCIALLLVPSLPLAIVAAGQPWWLAVGAVVSPFALYSIAPIRLPPDVRNFGDLVRLVAARNVRSLSDRGGRLGSAEAWAALKEVVSDHTTLPKEEITLDTSLMASAKATS